MTECEIRLNGVTTPEECFRRFFEATAGLVPDYGGRNLDAVHDDLGDIDAPLTLIFTEVDQAADALGRWFDRFVAMLAASIKRSGNLLTIVLRGTAARET